VLLPHTLFHQWDAYGEAYGGWDITNSNTGVHAWAEPNDKWIKPLDNVSGKWNPDPGSLIEYVSGKDALPFVQAAAARAYSQGWDVLTFMLEFRKTLEMFKNLLNNLISILSRGKTSVSLNTPTNKYLEGRYGWRQLIFDIQDINKAIESLNKERKRVSEKVGITIGEQNVNTYAYSIGDFGAFDIMVTDQIEIGLRGAISADFSPSNFQFNPIITGWEVIPFSFVVDWVLSVGQALSALSFVTVSSRYFASTGKFIRLTRKCQSSAPVFGAGWGGSHYVDSSWTGTYTERIPTSVPLRPFPRLHLDGWKIMDLLALFMQALGRR
jgi:hypothetical protein